MDFLFGGVAACGACLFTNPLEVVKTRLQLQGELRAPGTYPRHYRNVFHAFYTIARVDGLAALQRGLLPALLYQFSMNGLRLGIYGAGQSAGYVRTSKGHLSPLRSTVAGALAGVFAAIASSPIYMVRLENQTLGLGGEGSVLKRCPAKPGIRQFKFAPLTKSQLPSPCRPLR